MQPANTQNGQRGSTTEMHNNAADAREQLICASGRLLKHLLHRQRLRRRFNFLATRKYRRGSGSVIVVTGLSLT